MPKPNKPRVLTGCVVAALAMLIIVSPANAAGKKNPDAGYVYGPAPEWVHFRELAEQAVRAQLIDPGSATFEWPYGYVQGGYSAFLSKRAHGYVTCGYVNSRNRMGGYVGRTAFAVVIDYDIVTAVDIGTSTGVDFVAPACAKGNLPPASTMASEPAPNAEGFAFSLTAVPDGAYIASVTSGSAAEAAGLRPGMVVQLLNGVSVREMALATVNQILAAADGPVTLTMVGGNTVKVPRESTQAAPPGGTAPSQRLRR